MMYIHTFICCSVFLNVVASTVPLMRQGLRKHLQLAKVFLIGFLILFIVRFNPRNTGEQNEYRYEKGVIFSPHNRLLQFDNVSLIYSIP